ncbi:MAG: PAS domain S-box protein [Bacteroidales bacterium]|nr:PAS domain S-box protein [Bacteroidales bacterium]
MILEKDDFLQAIYSLFLETLGHCVLTVTSNIQEFLINCEKQKADLALVDTNVFDKESIELTLKKIYYEYDIPVILITSHFEQQNIDISIRDAIYGIIVKPIDKNTLSFTLDLVYWRHQYKLQKEISEHLINESEVAILNITLNGRIVYKNKATTKIFENSDVEYLYDLLKIKEETFYKEIIEEVLRDSYLVKYFIISQSNKQKYLKTTFSILFDELNEIYGVIAYINDETEKFEFLRDFQIISGLYISYINSSNHLFFVFNKNMELVVANPAVNKFYSTVLNKNISKENNFNEIFYFHSNLKELHEFFKSTLQGVYHYTEETIKVDDKVYYINFQWIPVKIKEEIPYVLIIGNDNSKYKLLEKEYNQLLEEIKPIFDTSIQRFYLTDLNYKLISFNKAAKDIIFKEFGRILKKGDDVLSLISTEERKNVFVNYFELAKKGHSISYTEEYSIRGQIHYNEVHLDPIINEQGNISCILIWTLDITDKQIAIKQLEEANKRYELIVKGSNDGIFDWDMVKNTVFLSPRWKALLGYKDYELPSEFGVRDSLIHPDDKEKADAILNEYLEGKREVYENEFRLRHKNGSYVWVIERGEIYRDEYGNNLRFAGAITDVTRLKQTEEKLLKLNKTLQEERELFIQGNVVITRINAPTNKFIYISENVQEVLGFKPEEFKRGEITYDELIHPDDYDLHLKEREYCVKNYIRRITYTPYRMRKKDGNYIWVKDFSTIIYDEEKNSYDILGYFIDITEQKTTEEMLKQAKLRYQSLFDEASDAIFLLDDFIIIELNKSASNILKLNKEKILNNSILKFIPETLPNGQKSEDLLRKAMKEAILGNNSKIYLQLLVNDEIFDVEVSINIVVLGNKKICFQLVMHDITERLRNERLIKENEERIKSLIEAIPDLLFILDKNYNYIYFKPDRERKLAKDDSKVIGKNLSDFFSGKVYEDYKMKLDSCLYNNKVEIFYYEMNTPIGIRKFETRLIPLPNQQILQIVRDIS